MTTSRLATLRELDTTTYFNRTRGRRVTSNASHKPKWVILHSAICCDGATNGAENLSTYLRNGAGGRQVSWHYSTDRDSAVQTLKEDWIGRHSGSTTMDNASIAIEMAVNIAPSENHWLTNSNYRGTLETTSKLIADICQRNGITPRLLTVQQVKDGVDGITSHNASRLAFGGTSHTDPGATFPWTEFGQMITAASNTRTTTTTTRGGSVDEYQLPDTIIKAFVDNMTATAAVEVMFQRHLGRQPGDRGKAHFANEIYQRLEAGDNWHEALREINFEIYSSDEAVRRRR